MKKAATKILEIFSGAFEHESVEAMEQYLDEACRDQVELRQEVEELLLSHRKAGAFLGGTSPVDGIGSGENPVDLSGTSVGPYKLLEPIGEGGMGTVYMAQQNEPVKRRVAIKLIKPGMDSQQVIARFEAERQALALMDHPNVAKVLDAGSTETGRPYFAMELVKGKPITQFCDQQQLDTDSRLKLFQQICQGVQHAHQKGIIHRDLKPSNILVAKYDDQPIPKVIDFGVAKATGDELTEQTMFTRFGQIIGTLEYMSPEQAQFNNLDIDTRSDIYSLGAILYELLAGEPPFERERLKEQALDDTLRMIREEEPTKPSTKLSGTAKSDHVASIRQSTADKLGAILKGDLDWIVMKALDKDRTRRYDTANALAEDIRRYLNDEPVLACSPSSLYRFRKFARRNTVGLAFILMAGTFLVAGFAGLIISNQLITHQKKVAEAKTVELRNQSQRADHNLDRALESVDHLLTRMADEVLLNTPGMEQLRKQLYEDALHISQSIVENQSSHAAAQRRVAMAQFNVGRINQYLGNLGAADEAYRLSVNQWQDWLDRFTNHASGSDSLARLANAHEHWSRLSLDRSDLSTAIKHLQTAKNIRTELAEDPTSRNKGELLQDIALSHVHYGDLLRIRGKMSIAQSEYATGVIQLERLIGDDPENAELQARLAWAHGHLAILYRDLGQPAMAIQHLESSQALLKSASGATNQAWIMIQYSENLRDLGRLLIGHDRRRAKSLLRQAIVESEKLCQQFPHVPHFTSIQSEALRNLGKVHEEFSEFDLAQSVYEKANDLYRSLSETFPNAPDWQDELAGGLSQIANLLHTMGRREEAESALREAIGLRETLAEEFSDLRVYRQKLAVAYESYARDLTKFHRDFVAAERVARKALPVVEGLISDFPNRHVYLKLQADIYGLIGGILLEQQQPKTGIAELLRGLAIVETLSGVADYPTQEAHHEMVVRFKANLAIGHCMLGEFDEAGRIFIEAIETINEMIARHPNDPAYKHNLAGMHVNLGNTYKVNGDFDAAENQYYLAIETYKSLLSTFPHNEEFTRLMASTHKSLAYLHGRRGDARNTLDSLRKALELGLELDAEKLRRSSDLKSIRDNQEFKQLLEELKEIGIEGK